MKILLIGEYSNVHWTLAEGLRVLGHNVTVASDGDSWKNFKRDIDFNPKNIFQKAYFVLNREVFPSIPSIQYIKLTSDIAKQPYDIVQVINPFFIHDSLPVIRRMFMKLKNQSGKIFLGAYGEDSYYAQSSMNKDLRYSILDPYFADESNKHFYENFFHWLKPDVFGLNQWMAEQSDGIIAGAFEYYTAYKKQFQNKLILIPFPVNLDRILFAPANYTGGPVRFIHGQQKGREIFKGTPYLLDAMNIVKEKYPNDIDLKVTVSLGYDEWHRELSAHHVLLDQVYGYSQGMSTLQAMANGRICFAGCEPEFLEDLGAKSAPIFNVLANVDHNVKQITKFMEQKHRINEWSEASRTHVNKFHNHVMIAEKQINFWTR